MQNGIMALQVSQAKGNNMKQNQLGKSNSDGFKNMLAGVTDVKGNSKKSLNESGNMEVALNTSTKKLDLTNSNKQASELSKELTSLLENVLNKEDLLKVLGDIENPEGIQALMSDVESFMEGLQLLMEQIPLQDGFLTEDMLQSPMVQNLLNQLPDSVVSEMKQLFNSNFSVEEVIQSPEELQSQAKLLATLIVLANAEKDLSNTADFLNKLTKQLENSLGISLKSDSTDYQSLLKNVVDSLKGSSEKEGQTAQKLTNSLGNNDSFKLFKTDNNVLNKVQRDVQNSEITQINKLVKEAVQQLQNSEAYNQQALKTTGSTQGNQSTEVIQKLSSMLLPEIEQLMKQATKGMESNDFPKLKGFMQSLLKEGSFKVVEQVTTQVGQQLSSLMQKLNVDEVQLSQLKQQLESMLPDLKQGPALKSQNNTEDFDLALKSLLDSMQVSKDDKITIPRTFQEQSPLNKLQQYVIHVTQGEAKPESNQQQILKQFQSVFKQGFQQASTNGNSQFLIKLNPEHLGQLTVKLMQIDGKMMANIIASSKTAKGILESNIHQLRNGLTLQNVNIEKFDIQVQDEQSSHDLKRDEGQEKRNSQDSQDKRDEASSEQDEGKTFADSFDEELMNLTV